MNLLYSFLLPTLLIVSLTGQDEPYKPEGKLPEGFSFKKCAEDDIECLESRNSFMNQYKHNRHRRTNEFYTHNFFMNNNQILHISSNEKLVVHHDIKNNRIDVSVKVANKDNK